MLMFDKLVIYEWLSIFQCNFVVDNTHVNQIALFQNCAIKDSARDPPQLVILHSFRHLDEETLHFVYDCNHGGEKWG